MTNQQNRGPTLLRAPDGLVEGFFALGVGPGVGFVQAPTNGDRQHGAGQCNPLSLAPGTGVRPLLRSRFCSLGASAGSHVVRASHLGRFHHFRRVRIHEAGDVIAHRAAEQLHVLAQVADILAEIGPIPQEDIRPVQLQIGAGGR